MNGPRGPDGLSGAGFVVTKDGYGYAFEAIRAGDYIRYKGSEAIFTVEAVVVTPPRRGLGGMDQGAPENYRIIFTDGSHVDYDRWMALDEYRVPFKVTRGPERAIISTINPAAIKM